MLNFIGMLSRVPFFFTEQWLEAWTQGATLQRAAITAFIGAKDGCDARSRWLLELTRASETYMRSPAFLRLSRDALDALIVSTTFLNRIPSPAWALARLR